MSHEKTTEPEQTGHQITPVVQLAWSVIYKGSRHELRFVKSAPTLPAGVTWHKGLLVEEEDDWLTVEDVLLKLNGDVRVSLEDAIFHSEWDDEQLALFVKDGWAVDRIWQAKSEVS